MAVRMEGWVCGCRFHDKWKTPDWNDLKLGMIVVSHRHYVQDLG